MQIVRQRDPVQALPGELVADLPQHWHSAPPVWQFGYGSFDASSGRTSCFTPLGHWTGSSWQGGAALPDPDVGWVLLHADGGHPGNNPSCAAIRRWTAPVDGTLTVRGTLRHESDNGNGVRGRVVVSSCRLVGEWSVRHGEAPSSIDEIVVKEGDTVDFITDCLEDVTSDSFTWRVELTLTQEGDRMIRFDSHEGFHGPVGEGSGLEIASVIRAWQSAYSRLPSRDELQAACAFLTRQSKYLRLNPQYTTSGRSPELQAFTNLCQALLSSNEFLYVD